MEGFDKTHSHLFPYYLSISSIFYLQHSNRPPYFDMTTSANIPVIDLSGDQAQVARQLVDAAEDHGFIYIRNLGHDISPLDIDKAFKIVPQSSNLDQKLLTDFWPV